MLLPVETMGIALPEDVDEVHLSNDSQRFGFLGSSKGEPEHSVGAGKDQGDADTAPSPRRRKNPFAEEGQTLASNGTAQEYRDQYGLDSTVEQ